MLGEVIDTRNAIAQEPDLSTGQARQCTQHRPCLNAVLAGCILGVLDEAYRHRRGKGDEAQILRVHGGAMPRPVSPPSKSVHAAPTSFEAAGPK